MFQMENRQQSMMGLVRFFFFECCFSFGQKIKFDLVEVKTVAKMATTRKKIQTFVRAQNIILSILMIKIQSSIHHHHHHHR